MVSGRSGHFSMRNASRSRFSPHVGRAPYDRLFAVLLLFLFSSPFSCALYACTTAVRRQAVASLKSNIFPSKSCCNCRKRRDLPVRLEMYTRAIARRSLDMAGRPASEIGVAGIFAESFEANVPAEQRAGTRSVGCRTGSDPLRHLQCWQLNVPEKISLSP